jgi:hypothetical protein
MKLFEVFQRPVQIVATKRFLKNAAFYVKGYPGVEATLREFLEAKVRKPNQPFGKKDGPFVAGALKGIWHFHLFHGKVVLIYLVIDNQLRLYDVVEHAAFDSKSASGSLAEYIESLGRSDFMPYGQPEEREASLSREQMQELEGLFFEMSIKDRDILETAARGQFADLFEFTRLMLGDDTDELVVKAFGGPDGLATKVKTVLRNTAVQA